MSKYDRLFEFIPLLETISIDDAVQWSGGKTSPEGVITMPFPSYNEQINAFMNTIYALDILDKDYMTTIRACSIHTSDQLDSALNNADEKLAIALLTYYVRQERFCDGLWATAIRENIFLRIIQRLHELQT